MLAGVGAACLYRATTISASNGARVLARAHPSASAPAAPLIVTAEHGAGRVVVLADSDLFGDDCLDELDHRTLWLNLIYWVAGSGVSPGPKDVSGRRADVLTRYCVARPARGNRRPGCASGRGRITVGDGEVAQAARGARSPQALDGWSPASPTRAEYLEGVAADLRSWAQTGFGAPDFTRALAAFRPDRHRTRRPPSTWFFSRCTSRTDPGTLLRGADGARPPGPTEMGELERTRYQNPKFVPVELLSGTRGYDSECAVLFPEMVSVAGAPNNFGAIFCDREAERLRRVAGAAADLLSLNLPPDAARMLASPRPQQAYILWDLIHDRAHSHGELPFDPFMIRQRSPYWMYSLEELRCDLTAFAQAQELERDGPAARAGGPLRPLRHPA